MATSNPLATAAFSFVAGWVDTLGFLALGLFTSHVTGNFVLMFVALARPDPGLLGKILSIPVFIVVAGACSLAVAWRGPPGRRGIRGLLAGEAALLAGFMAAAAATAGAPLVAMVGVAAMAVQNAVNRLGVPPGPSTTVMTVNLSQVAVDLAHLARHPADREPRRRLRTRLPGVIAFAAGCAAGAGGYVVAQYWALAVPTAIVAVLAAIA